MVSVCPALSLMKTNTLSIAPSAGAPTNFLQEVFSNTVIYIMKKVHMALLSKLFHHVAPPMHQERKSLANSISLRFICTIVLLEYNVSIHRCQCADNNQELLKKPTLHRRQSERPSCIWGTMLLTLLTLAVHRRLTVTNIGTNHHLKAF